MSRYTTFKHWLFNKFKKPYYLDDMGNVLVGDINTLKKPNGQPAFLQHAPLGWKGTEINFKSSDDFWGLITDFVISLRLVLDGRAIVNELMWRSIDPTNSFYESVLYYGLSKWDNTVYPAEYKVYYLGEVDFSEWNQTKETTEIKVIAGGSAKYLTANKGKTYEIPISADAEVKQVYLDGIPFDNTVEYTVYKDQQFDGVASGYSLGMGIVFQEGTTLGIMNQDQPAGVFNLVQPNFDWFMNHSVNNATVSAKITGSFKVELGGNWAGIRFYKYTIVDDVSVAVQDYLPAGQPNGAGIHTFDIDISIPMKPGDRLYGQKKGDTANPGIDHWIRSGELKVTYEVTVNPTFTKAITLYRLFELLTEKMTAGKFQCESAYLKLLDSVFVTSGMALRDFQASDTVIKISFNDYYQALQRFGVMLFIKNNVLYIERKAQRFQAEIVADLGVVSNIVITHAKDKIANSIKAGYPNQTYDSVNGLDEFNVTQEWSMPILTTAKELDLTSPIRADMYGIELTRLNLTGKDTTDSKSDNDTFYLSVEKGVENIAYFTGAIEVTNGDTITIPGTLMFMNGIEIEIDGVGVFTVINTSHLVVGFTTLTVTPGIVNGTYNTSIIYDNPTAYKLLRPTYSSITGVAHPDRAFNTLLTPKAAMLENGPLLSSMAHFNPGAFIEFATGEKNSDLSTTLNGVTLTQKANIQVAELGKPFFYPYYLEFETEVPINFLDIMKVNPHGTIQVTNQHGDTLYGFMWMGSVRPAINDRQKWKLLCSPKTDLKLLAK